MAIIHRLDLAPVDTGKVFLPTSSLAITKGCLYASDRSNKVVVAVTNSVGTTLTSLWVATRTLASTVTQAEFIPVLPHMLFQIDCTANTAATQLMIRHGMTDLQTLNNTTTDLATTLGIFEALAVFGAATSNSLIGRFIHIGQVSA